MSGVEDNVNKLKLNIPAAGDNSTGQNGTFQTILGFIKENSFYISLISIVVISAIILYYIQRIFKSSMQSKSPSKLFEFSKNVAFYLFTLMFVSVTAFGLYKIPSTSFDFNENSYFLFFSSIGTTLFFLCISLSIFRFYPKLISIFMRFFQIPLALILIYFAFNIFTIIVLVVAIISTLISWTPSRRQRFKAFSERLKVATDFILGNLFIFIPFYLLTITSTIFFMFSMVKLAGLSNNSTRSVKMIISFLTLFSFFWTISFFDCVNRQFAASYYYNVKTKTTKIFKEVFYAIGTSLKLFALISLAISSIETLIAYLQTVKNDLVKKETERISRRNEERMDNEPDNQEDSFKFKIFCVTFAIEILKGLKEKFDYLFSLSIALKVSNTDVQNDKNLEMKSFLESSYITYWSFILISSFVPIIYCVNKIPFFGIKNTEGLSDIIFHLLSGRAPILVGFCILFMYTIFRAVEIIFTLDRVMQDKAELENEKQNEKI